MKNWKTGTTALAAALSLCACGKSGAGAGAARAADLASTNESPPPAEQPRQPYGYRGNDGAQAGYANTMRREAAQNAAAARTGSAIWDGYYIPDAWRRQAFQSRDFSAFPGTLEAMSAVFYEKPDLLQQPEERELIAYLTDCKSGSEARGNEIRRGQIQQQAVDSFLAYTRAAKPEGISELGGRVVYNTATGKFDWDGAGPGQPILVGGMANGPSPICNGSGIGSFGHTYSLGIRGGKIPPFAMPVAEADAFLQRHPDHYVAVRVHFRLTGPVRADGTNYTAIAEFTGAEILEPGNQHVLARVGSQG